MSSVLSNLTAATVFLPTENEITFENTLLNVVYSTFSFFVSYLIVPHTNKSFETVKIAVILSLDCIVNMSVLVNDVRTLLPVF